MKHIYFLGLFFLTFIVHLNAFVVLPEQKGSVILIVGTRPDGIKMAPIYHALKQLSIPTLVCSTDQHTDLLLNVLKTFDVIPDYHLNVMKPGQDLFHITTSILEQLKDLYTQVQPSLVLVQGDTTSAMAAALAAFYLKIPVGHVEAGLRTYNMLAPFPEELNRRIIALIASYHFAPTQLAVDCLLAEDIDESAIFNVGNSIVDALNYIQQKIAAREIVPSDSIVKTVTDAKAKNQKIILLTAHRRESFAGGLHSIFTAIKTSLELHSNLFIIYPTHPNPAIKKILEEVQLGKSDNIAVIEPLSYIDMVYLLTHVDGVATDSGGLQEEAVSLNKPVLILRHETERFEGVRAGISHLVGDNQELIIAQIGMVMQSNSCEKSANTIYGCGNTGKQIAHIIKEKYF